MRSAWLPCRPFADPVQSMLATDATKLRGGKFVPVRIGIYPFAHAFRPGTGAGY